jgi:hypothetical protein
MQFPVLVEPVDGNGYRARAGQPFAFTVEGATRDEVLQKFKQLIRERLDAETEVELLEIPVNDNPWLQMAGTLDLDDPLVKEWIQIMEENRRKVDEDPDYL